MHVTNYLERMKISGKNIFTRTLRAESAALAGLIILIFLFVINILKTRFIQDDAFIFFRYVKNFVNGNGLVFNTGERVEGYTSFLWVTLLSGIEKINKIFSLEFSLESIAQCLSVFFGIVVLVLTFILSRMIGSYEKESKGKFINNIYELLPVMLMAFSTPLIYWSASAMETSFFISLLLLSIIFYLKGNKDKPNYPFVIISVINSLLRPEGMIFFALIILHKIYAEYIKEQNHKSIQRFAKSISHSIKIEVLLFLIPISVFLLFRLIYYGYLLPNTFYAKTEFNFQFIKRGIDYFLDFAKTNLLFGIFFVIPIAYLIYSKKLKQYSLFLWLIFSWIVLVVLIGGDVLPIHRFFIQIMPLIYILFIQSIFEMIQSFIHRLQIKTIIEISFIIFIVGYSIFNYGINKEEMMIKRSYESGLVKKMKIYAEWIEKQDKNKLVGKNNNYEFTVAMSTIGSFSYNANVRVIDLVGLTDSYIAHHPKEVEGIDEELPILWKERHYNAEYVLDQKPDYIIFPAGAKPSAFAECAIFVQPEFYNNYYAQLFYSEELHQMLPIFTRMQKPRSPIADNDCNVKFVKHYINATNLFLKLTETDEKSIIEKITEECDSVIHFCPQRFGDAVTIKGMAYYHSNDFKQAEKYLLEAVNKDPYNSLARFYLKNIYIKKGNYYKAMNLILQILKISPGAMPNLTAN